VTEVDTAEPPHETVGAGGLSRRAFLLDSAGATLLVFKLRYDHGVLAAVRRGASLALVRAVDERELASPKITIAAERDTDLMLADFTFHGFSVDKRSDPPALVAGSTTSEWVGVIVQLPPQAIGEGVYPYQTSPYLTYDPTPIVSQTSGPSRLAFSFGAGARIPLPTMTVADLLDWSGWSLSVQPTAIAGDTGTSPRAPYAYETAVECPLDLILAPVVYPVVRFGGIIAEETTTEFVSGAQPVTSSRRVTECWSTSLTGSTRSFVRPIEGPSTGSLPYEPSVAVVWASDYGPGCIADATPATHIDYGPYIAPPK